MSNKLNKKGISDVIAVTILLAMTITSLFLFGYFILDLSKETTQLAPAVSCLEMNSKIESVCYDEEKTELKIELQRGLSDEGIKFFMFSVEAAGQSDSYYCGEKCEQGSCEIPGKGETKILYLNLETFPEKISLIANENCNLGKKEIKAC